MKTLKQWSIVSWTGEIPGIENADFENNSFSFECDIAGRVDDAKVPVRFKALSFSVIGEFQFAVTGCIGACGWGEAETIKLGDVRNMLNPRTSEVWAALCVFHDNWLEKNQQASVASPTPDKPQGSIL